MKNYQRLKYLNALNQKKAKGSNRCKKQKNIRKIRDVRILKEWQLTDDKYLNQVDATKNGNLHDQSWAMSHIFTFHGICHRNLNQSI